MQTLSPLHSTRSETFKASVPGSKSYTNRALILASQRMGTTVIENGLVSEDTELLAAALDAFGGLSVVHTDGAFRVTREKDQLTAPQSELFMGGAGTPARFMLAFAAGVEGATVVTGNPRLSERPMADVLDTLASLGVAMDFLGEVGHLPVRIHGTKIDKRDWSVHAGVSSQFTSSLCLHAAQQDWGPIRISLEGNQVSVPYVDMTLAMLSDCGLMARRDGPDRIVVVPGSPQNDVIRVEVDASGMSYFLAAAAVTRSTVEIDGIGASSAQGDVDLARAFESMGCELEMSSDSLRITGGQLTGIDIDMERMPDVVLTLAAVAAVAEGPTRITNIANLRVKECDRINAAARELERLGAAVEEGSDFLVIHPSSALRPAKIETYDDHRVAMAFSVLGLVAPGIEILDPGCVAKSFPGYWAEYDRFRSHHENL